MDELKEMFNTAKKERLWFYSSYQQLWFSPEELEQYQKDGRYRWGSNNWKLRDPWEEVQRLNDLISNLQKSKIDFVKKIEQLNQRKDDHRTTD